MAIEILKLPTVIQRTGLSRSTIYALIAQGRFPKPINISERSVGWVAAEIEQWLEERMTMSRAASGRG